MASAHLQPDFDFPIKTWVLICHECLPEKSEEILEETYHNPFRGNDR